MKPTNKTKDAGTGSASSGYSLLPIHIGIDFWNPTNGEIVKIEGDKIKWFEDNFATVKGYEHYFEIKEE